MCGRLNIYLHYIENDLQKIVLQFFSLVVSFALKIQHFEFPSYNIAWQEDRGRDKAALVDLSLRRCVYTHIYELTSKEKALSSQKYTSDNLTDLQLACWCIVPKLFINVHLIHKWRNVRKSLGRVHDSEARGVSIQMKT